MIYELISKIADYRVRGVISQRDRDQGDSLNRTGVYYSCLAALGWDYVIGDFHEGSHVGLSVDLDKLRGSVAGRYRRGNDSTRWFYNENNVTRDQMTTVEAAMALNGLKAQARAHFKLRLRRLFFHFSTQNDGADAGPLKHKLPDLPTPDEMGNLIRATRYKFLYFLLPLTDLWLLMMVKYGRRLSERSLYDSDNQLLPTVLAALDQPTFVTEYVRRAYATTDAAARLRRYYSEAGDYNGIEPLGELCVLAFERAVGGLST
ncbi:MAG: hypothetical protein ACAH17_03495 [Candidatus Paceibacterota bacterium]